MTDDDTYVMTPECAPPSCRDGMCLSVRKFDNLS